MPRNELVRLRLKWIDKLKFVFIEKSFPVFFDF